MIRQQPATAGRRDGHAVRVGAVEVDPDAERVVQVPGLVDLPLPGDQQQVIWRQRPGERGEFSLVLLEPCEAVLVRRTDPRDQLESIPIPYHRPQTNLRMSIRLTATVTATAATIGNQQRPVTAHNSRRIYANWGYVRPEKRTVEDQCRERSDCCQYCCQAAGQRLSRTDNSGMSAQHTDRNGRSWTMCLLLRIRRLQFGLQFNAVPRRPRGTERARWSSLNRSEPQRAELLMRLGGRPHLLPTCTSRAADQSHL